MKKSKAIKGLSCLLCLALALSLVCAAPVVGSAAEEQVTYFDFEDGVNPLYKAGGTQKYDDSQVITEADGNKALKLSGISYGVKNDAYPFSNGYFTLGNGIVDGWGSTTRPTRVAFRLLIAGQNQQDTIFFHPFWTASAGNYNVYKLSLKNWQDHIEINATNYFATQLYFVDGDTPAERFGTKPIGNAATELASGSWYDCVCDYDWTNFNAEHGYEVSFTFSITDGTYTQTYMETLKWRAPTNAAYTGDPMPFTDTTGFSIAFEGGDATTATQSAIDDLCIWSYDAADPAKTYAPKPVVKALGAVAATAEDESGNVNVKSSFDFRTAQKIAEAGGETISYFGALVAAGTKTPEEMQAALETALESDTAPEGFVFVKNMVSAVLPLPDIYTVTIVNSGEIENMGKRLSAIAYIITESGTYYSTNTNAQNDVTGGVVNKSSMGLLKDQFNEKYLKADYSTALANALADYNAESGENYTRADVEAAATSTGVTSTKDRNLLKGLYQLLLIETGGEESIFPGIW